MTNFCLKESGEYYLQLSEHPVRFDAVSPVTNVFFDDTNGQVFTVHSGGVAGVTVSSMDKARCTSFMMEDKGTIISIKFSPDQRILAIQRSRENQNATVDFVNFKELTPTKVEYSHVCKWKNAKILGFVWPKPNEIAFVTDHGIELLQVLPDKKQLKSIKSTSFSAAWFCWCAQSKVALLAGNNGILLQPFSLNNSTIGKLHKLELDTSRPVAERDVYILKVCGTTWCALLRHGASATVAGPAELFLMPLTGPPGTHPTHILKTCLIGRFAVNVVDDLVVVHHQASHSSLLFDIMEETSLEQGVKHHIPIVAAKSLKPFILEDQQCPMYSGNWVVLQPDYIIDARLGCLWKVELNLSGLAHCVPKDEVSKVVAALLRRLNAKETIYQMLDQLVEDAGNYLVQLSKVFDEINTVYRKWLDSEIARNTAQVASQCSELRLTHEPRVLVKQRDVHYRILQPHAEHPFLVQVVTSYIASLSALDIPVEECVSEACARALVMRGQCSRLTQCVRHGCLGDGRALACLLLSLGNLEPAAPQLALDMLTRLKANEEVVEVLLGRGEAVSASGWARSAGAPWRGLPARKVLAAAPEPAAFVALYHALEQRNTQTRGLSDFLKGEQCDRYVQHYKDVTSEPN